MDRSPRGMASAPIWSRHELAAHAHGYTHSRTRSRSRTRANPGGCTHICTHTHAHGCTPALARACAHTGARTGLGTHTPHTHTGMRWAGLRAERRRRAVEDIRAVRSRVRHGQGRVQGARTQPATLRCLALHATRTDVACARHAGRLAVCSNATGRRATAQCSCETCRVCGATTPYCTALQRAMRAGPSALQRVRGVTDATRRCPRPSRRSWCGSSRRAPTRGGTQPPMLCSPPFAPLACLFVCLACLVRRSASSVLRPAGAAVGSRGCFRAAVGRPACSFAVGSVGAAWRFLGRFAGSRRDGMSRQVRG